LNVLFIPCTIDGLSPTSASLRFRAQWPAKYWPGADVYPDCRLPLAEYDAYIFQKAYLGQKSQSMIRSLRRAGKLLALDMCDADWLQSAEHERRLLSVLPLFDLAVSPTRALAEWLGHWVPAYVIPDRLDLDEFQEQHEARRVEPHSLVWFGYAQNLVELDKVWGAFREVLHRYDLPLTILSNELPDDWRDRYWSWAQRPQFVKWTPDSANAEIARHTIALVPSSNPFKSNNRMVTAWALGLLAARTADELREQLLYDRETRSRHLWIAQESVQHDYAVSTSAMEWKHLLHTFAERMAEAQDIASVHNQKGASE
jgi:hypothetical protein